MKTFNRTQITTIAIVMLLIILITLGSFVLSFRNINNTVNNYYTDLSFIFPLIIDFSIVVFIIVRFVGSLIDDARTKNISLILIVLATALSLLFNQFDTIELALTQGLNTSGDVFTVVKGIFAHLVPPLFLLLVVEAVVIMIQGVLHYRGIVIDSQKLITEAQNEAKKIVNTAQDRARELLREEDNSLILISQRQERINELDLQIEAREQEIKDSIWKEKVERLNSKQLKVLKHIGKPQRHIAEETGIALSQVNGIVADLKEEGYIVENEEKILVLNKNGVVNESIG